MVAVSQVAKYWGEDHVACYEGRLQHTTQCVVHVLGMMMESEAVPIIIFQEVEYACIESQQERGEREEDIK